jgi:hypothetical protein
MTARQFTRDQILRLPPASTLPQLGQVFGVSEPTIRALHRSGELERMGIRVVKLGAQYRVVTATVWAYLGMADGASRATTRSNGAGQAKPTDLALRPFRQRGGSASA